VNQGVNIKNPGLLCQINLQKEELKSELIKALDLTGKDNKVIEGLMKDFSKQLEDLTNQYLENGKV
jgi:hypothetical protein